MPPSTLLTIKNLSIAVNDRSLFDHLSMSVLAGELVALAGGNGCGKSTLLNLIAAQAGLHRYDLDEVSFSVKGHVNISAEARLAYVPQVPGDLTDSVSEHDKDWTSSYPRLCRDFDLNPDRQALEHLSGGERQKQALVTVLASDADLYLLDEPTNYLDIAGITAFEYHLERLKQNRKGIVLVTHDRVLTDNFADRTILISQHGIFSTSGGASDVRVVEETHFESRRARARDIGRKIEQLQADVRAKAGWSAVSEKRKIGGGMSRPYYGKLSKKMAARAKAVQRRVDREIEELARAKPFVPKKLSLSFPKYEIAHRDVFHLSEVSFGYLRGSSTPDEDQRERIIESLTFSATTRDRYCLMGKNGSGKTTVVKLIEGALAPIGGTVSTNAGVRTASIPQKLDDFFARSVLLENFQDCGLKESAIRQHLGSVLIRKDKVHEPIENFSRGELMRAAVAKCVLLRAEFLILDEPTSNLDIASIEVLEKILTHFQGGFLVISHDRRFAVTVADRLYLLEEGKLRLM